MSLRVNPENGALLKLDNGSLMKKCCCDPPDESGWYRCDPVWCTGAFTAPERFPEVPIVNERVNFMMWFTESSRQKWDEELGSPNFYYDGRMLWEIKEFLTGDPDPTDFNTANGWLSVPRQSIGFDSIVMSELENGYPEAAGSEYGFLSNEVPKEFTVIDANNRRVFHGLRFTRGESIFPNGPVGFEIQSWQEAYRGPFFPDNSSIRLGLPPNHNAWRSIEIEDDPNFAEVILGVNVPYQGSFPEAGFVTSLGPAGVHEARTTINWFGGEYTVSGICFLGSFGGRNNGGLAYPNEDAFGCKSYNMVSGLYHWSFPLTFPGAGGHVQYGDFDINSCRSDLRPCFALTKNADAVPDCVRYPPPCFDAGLPPGSGPLPNMQHNYSQCGFIIPYLNDVSRGTAFSLPLDVCQTAFGEDCPGGAASDWFGAANSYQSYFVDPSGSIVTIAGVSKSFDDTGLAPMRFNIPPSGTLPGGVLNQQCALEIRFS